MAKESITCAFLTWLGSEIFREKDADRYVAVYRKFIGSLEGADHLRSELDWEAFKATVDAWATLQMSAFLYRKKNEGAKLLPHAESRDTLTGLRRGHRVTPLSVNAASEEALRQVPGIGISSARKISEARAIHGNFESLEQLVERGCISQQSLELGREYLSTFSAPAPSGASLEYTADFVAYVRVRHALQHAGRDTDLGRVSIAALEEAISSVRAPRYWGPSRSPQDPAILYIDEGNVHHDEVLYSRQTLPTALLNSQSYLKLLKRIFPRAKSRIWVQAPSLSMLHVRPLRSLLVSLADAVARNVDVRVLFDERYAPGPIDGDDIAYLRACNVPCRAYPLVARMHSRVVILDSEHVVCGSHSWSANSFFSSEELGFYVHSQRLAEQQADRFKQLWHAAAPDKRFDLSLFRLWSKATHESLLRAGITDPQQIISVDTVDGLQTEELNVLRREVRLVIENSLPVPIAHRLAKAGVEDLTSIANLNRLKIDRLIENKAEVAQGSDLTPLGYFLSTYVSGEEA